MPYKSRDEVSGIKKVRESCLEDSTPIDVRTRLWLARHVQNQSRITLMRRICSFTDIYCVVGFSAPAGRNDCHVFSLVVGNPALYRRKNET